MMGACMGSQALMMGATLSILSIVGFPAPNNAVFAEGGTYHHDADPWSRIGRCRDPDRADRRGGGDPASSNELNQRGSSLE